MCMTTVAANKLIQSLALSLSIDGEVIPLTLESAALNYLIGNISHAQLQAKAQSLSGSSIIFYKALVLLSSPPPQAFNTDTLTYVHSCLFGDIFPKCGQLRKVNLDSYFGSHTDYKYLKGSLKTVLSRLSAIKGSPKISKTDFIAHLAHYLQEFNILSPFNQGNGITRRTFFSLFALSRGFEINLALTTPKDFAYAENQAFVADDPQPLYSCLIKCVAYIGQDSRTPQSINNRTTPTLRLKSISPARKVKPKQARKPKPITSAMPSPLSVISPETYEDVTTKIKIIQTKLSALNEELATLLSTLPKK